MSSVTYEFARPQAKVPAMNPAERAGMLGDMQAHAPAPAFVAALDVVRPHLSARDWAKLCRSLNLPADQAVPSI